MPNDRSTRVSVDIGARPSEVWAALTEADLLTQWFPLEATVRPGVGGTTRWAWDGEWSWVSEIERWEPGRVLRLVNRDQRPFDAEGRAVESAAVPPATLVMEFTLEASGGVTRLTLVHSGFGPGAAWDDELDGVAVGWQFELRSLKFYLERHRGRRRRAGAARITAPFSQSEAWGRLVGDESIAIEPWPPAGERTVVRSEIGRYGGEVLVSIRDREFAMVADELGAGIFRLGTHRSQGRTGVTVWHASYSADQLFIDEATGRSQALLDRLFGSER